MDDLSQRALEALTTLGFTLQPTSFSDITSEGEMSRIREYRSLPNSDSAKILLHFPQFFLIHHSAPPERGIFFVALADTGTALTREAEDIYERYFPADLLVVGQDTKHRLVAVWMGSHDKPRDLDKVIRDRLEA